MRVRTNERDGELPAGPGLLARDEIEEGPLERDPDARGRDGLGADDGEKAPPELGHKARQLAAEDAADRDVERQRRLLHEAEVEACGARRQRREGDSRSVDTSP